MKSLEYSSLMQMNDSPIHNTSSGSVVFEFKSPSSDNSQMEIDIVDIPDEDDGNPLPETSKSKSRPVNKEKSVKQTYVLFLLRTLQLLITSFFINEFLFFSCFRSKKPPSNAHRKTLVIANAPADNANAGASNSKNQKYESSDDFSIIFDESDEQPTINQPAVVYKTWVQRSKEPQTWV